MGRERRRASRRRGHCEGFAAAVSRRVDPARVQSEDSRRAAFRQHSQLFLRFVPEFLLDLDLSQMLDGLFVVPFRAGIATGASRGRRKLRR